MMKLKQRGENEFHHTKPHVYGHTKLPVLVSYCNISHWSNFIFLHWKDLLLRLNQNYKTPSPHCLPWSQVPLKPMPAVFGQQAGYILLLVASLDWSPTKCGAHIEKQLLILVITPLDNLTSMDLACMYVCFWTVGKIQSIWRTSTQERTRKLHTGGPQTRFELVTLLPLVRHAC